MTMIYSTSPSISRWPVVRGTGAARPGADGWRLRWRSAVRADAARFHHSGRCRGSRTNVLAALSDVLAALSASMSPYRDLHFTINLTETNVQRWCR